MNAINRYAPFFVAAVLPLLTFSWLMPKGVVQIDLWLLWLMAMVLLGLPMMFLELALSKRSEASVWQGMQTLTRQSDVPTYWRAFSLLSVILSLVLGAGFIARFSEAVTASPLIQSFAQIPSYALAFALTILALILSPLKHKPLMLGVALVALAAVLSAAMGGLSIAITPTSIGEWALAVVLALFSMGLGTGLYWFLDNTTTQTKPHALSSRVLPVWGCQVVFGIIAFGLSSTTYTPLASLIGVVGVVLVASFLFHYALMQLKGRFGLILGLSIGVALALMLGALPSQFLTPMLVVLGLLTAMSLSLFAGFAMKISHLRKSLNFKNEFRYNVWRIAIRWLVPLAVVSALIGWFL